MKDIFIDTNTACLFVKPPNNHFTIFVEWLMLNNTAAPADNGHLMMSNKLRAEFFEAHRGCTKQYSLHNIYFDLQKNGKLNFKSNKEIDKFKKSISKKVWDALNSKGNDSSHLPLVFLSDRKMVLSNDEPLLNDLINFPKLGKNVVYARTPETLEYR